MSEGVRGAAGNSPVSGTGPIKNPGGALAVALLAISPQLLALFCALIAPLSFGHITATFAGVGQLLTDPGIIRIYSLPMLVVAAVTAFVPVRGPQDYYGGIVMIATALFAFYASSDLPGMRGFQFGPGTAPRLFAGLLVLLGLGVSVVGVLLPGAQLERYHLRGPFFVTLAIVCFAVAIRPLGLIVTTFVSFMVAALGSPDQRWWQTVIVGIAITAFCCFLFPTVLGLPFQLKPRFMIQ
jgi:hypothetical protein